MSRRSAGRLAGLGGVVAVTLTIGSPGKAFAQRISVDGHLSPAQTLAGPNYAIGANLGRQVGGNLFHSFGTFGLNQGETATFSGPASVGNVIGRVTGGAASSIDGTIQSTITGASVYLINPAGVIFGPHAAVNVTGGFHASSADYLRLSDGSRFQATNPNASTLTAAAPAAFGFLSATPGAITINGSTIGPVTGRLALIGGPVTITNGVLLAPAGTVHIASAAGAGEIPVDPITGPAATVTQYGKVAAGGTRIAVSDTSGRGSGSVVVRGDTVAIAGGEIDADNASIGPGGVLAVRGDTVVGIGQGASLHAFTVTGSGANIGIATGSQGLVLVDASSIAAHSTGVGSAGGITINTGNLVLRDGAQVIDATLGPGAGGDLNLAGTNLTLATDATVLAATMGSGQGGNIHVALTGAAGLGTTGETTSQASAIRTLATSTGIGGSIQFSADALAIAGDSRIFTGSLNNAVAGPLSVSARSIALQDFGSIASSGGNVAVTASETLSMSGGSATATGSTIYSDTSTSRPAGDVFVQAGNIALGGTSTISSDTSGTGPAGNVTVNVVQSLLIDRPADLPDSAVKPGIDSNSGSQPGSAALLGPGGNVTVSAHDITIRNGVINADTFDAAPAGIVRVNATDALWISGSPWSGVIAGISAQSNNRTVSGRAGDVFVQAGSILITNQGEISSATFGSGDAGSVTVTASGGITINGSGVGLTGITSKADKTSSGGAGIVQVRAGSLALANAGAEISSNNLGSGAGSPSGGGTVTVVIAGSLTMSGGDATEFGGLIDASTSSGQPAGDVFVQAGNITLGGTSTISSNTSGAGPAGNVTVNAVQSLLIDRPADLPESAAKPGIDSNSGSQPGSVALLGRGGDVTVSAHDITIRNGVINADTFDAAPAGIVHVTATEALSISGSPGSSLFAGISAQSNNRTISGRAGDVFVQAGSILMNNQGEISTETFGSGDAGSVTVNAGNISVQDGARISSTTFGAGQNGSVAVHAAGAISLGGVGRQIATSSSGTGDAGSITIAAPRLTLSNGAAVSTQAQSANGGNITISVGDMLWLQRSSITTSVNGALGNGGNIRIDPQFVILDNSFVKANAIGGNGGNVDIVANDIVLSSDSAITASSQRGLSGDIVLSMPQLDLSSSLVVLASTLRSAVALLRESCAGRGDRPRSSLVVAGSGGIREEAQTSVSGLYLANRTVREMDGRQAAAKPAVPVTLAMSTRCH